MEKTEVKEVKEVTEKKLLDKIKASKDRVQEEIVKRVNSLEEFHKKLAQKPFALLGKMKISEATVGKVQEAHDKAVSNVYDFIRKMNDKTAKFADDLLEKGKKAA